jgi:hypothetical protein
VDVVVLETEALSIWREVVLTPGDHPAVEVDAEVPLGLRRLLDELTGESATSAAEVQHAVVRLRRNVGKDRPAAGVVVMIDPEAADEIAHLP